MRWSRFIPKSEFLDLIWTMTLGMCLGPSIPIKWWNVIMFTSSILMVFNYAYLKRREERLRRKNESTEALGNFKYCAETLVRNGALIDTLKELVDEAAVRATMTE